MLLHCVRHGESVFNAEGRIQGQTDIELSPLGHRQARALAAAFERGSIDAIYCSPLKRALETARPLAEKLGLPIETDTRLLEINVGIFQALLSSELATRHPSETERWHSYDPDYRIPGGETRRELMIRGQAALESIRDRGHQQAVVVAHGGLLSAAFKGLLGIPAERNPFMLYNASISTLSFQPQLKLLTLNQVEHLRTADCGLAARTGDL
jgi:broad specificity phosphatase PhoE